MERCSARYRATTRITMALTLVSALACATAMAQTPTPQTPTPPTTTPPHTSVGTPQDGVIALGGVELASRGAGYHWITNRENPSARFGTPALVAALAGAAADVAEQYPGSDLAIHDLSLAGGGPIRGHGSHRSGRDVDIAYYAVAPDGARIDPTLGVWFTPAGRARGAPLATAARLDVERTWHFLRTMLGDETISVQYVFVQPALRRAILAYAAARPDPSPALVGRGGDILRAPHGRRVDPHADHFHVRIHCPVADVAYGCSDS